MEAGQLRAGVSEIEYKPELGLMMADGAPVAKGYLTPLYVKALLLSNGHKEISIVSLDLIGIDRGDADRAAGLAQERCGMPKDNILMACSHTHVAPSSTPSSSAYREAFNPHYDEKAKQRELAFVDMIVETIADAVCRAKEGLQEASIGVATADLPWLIFNRRRHTRNYGVWTHWMGIPQDQAYRPEGPIDPDFGLFVVRDATHKPMCMLWNFSGHNSFNFGDQYSADLPYTVQAALDERIGEHVPCLYTPGCGGNTNYFDYKKPYGLDKATDGVASALMAIYREANTLPKVKLGVQKAELFFAPRDYSHYWWKHDIEMKLPSWTPYGQMVMEYKAEEIEDQATFQFDVMAMRLGEAALVGLPGEMFVEFGLMIKERSPFRHTYVAGYANGHAGYIATRRAFTGGSYEAWHGSARAGREGGYLMVDKAVELLEELYRE
jgi:hypothetical protein